MQTVLIIDDNRAVRTALEMLFTLHQLRVVCADSVAVGLAAVDAEPVDLVIQDMNFTEDTTSGEEGIALFHALRAKEADLPIILLTAWTHLETAVELVRAGAADYIAKPWDDHKLITTARNLLELREATLRSKRFVASRRAARERLESKFDLCGIVYESELMHELVTMATKVAHSDVPVLVTGANGAGKEKLAEIVQANSSCAGGEFVKVNVGALPAELMESELFGAEAGAYTGAGAARQGRFEAADGGTLFLDEIANLSLDGQAKLLRVLQTGEFERLGSTKTRRANVRVVSATNADLQQAVRSGTFREDLYYRLNVIELEVPPLNDRPEDILPLAWHFLSPDRQLDDSAERALGNHQWSGNVRELQNVIKRATLLAQGPTLTADDLGLAGRPSAPKLFTPGHAEPDAEAVLAALDRAGGVVAKAARALGLSRQAFYRRLEKFDIELKKP